MLEALCPSPKGSRLFLRWVDVVTSVLRTIAVDLTPVLPGGENGGAKIFVLELLRRLAHNAPDVQFILLTHVDSHEELAEMDRTNMSRHLTVGQTSGRSLFERARLTFHKCLAYLPGRVRNVALRVAYALLSRARRQVHGSLLHTMGADLLFCPFSSPGYSEAGIPVVCTLYDLQYKAYPEFFTPEEVANRDRTFTEACRKATMLVAISDHTRNVAMAHGHIDPVRIQTSLLRMAHRIAPDRSRGPEVLAGLGIEPQRYFVYPANFWKHKNHEMLLAAFGLAANQGLQEDMKLVCTGAPSPRQEWLARAAKAMGLERRVLFPGYLSNADLGCVLAHSRGMLFPSLYEGFGLPVAEAMAAGVPVACSNATSLPEVAGDAAVLFDPRVPEEIAAAIKILTEDDCARARMIEAGLERAAEFADSDCMAREYWEFFQVAAGAGIT